MRNALLGLTILLATGSAHAEDALDRAAITDGVAAVKAKVLACGDASKVGGKVKAKVTVGSDGKVTNVVANGSADAKLNACVAGALKTAMFKATKLGGSFSYPFVFGIPSPDRANPGLDRATITEGMAKLKGKLLACGDGSKASGTVKVGVKVAPRGAVTNVIVQATPDPKLGACVAGVIQTATFAKSPSGGSFSYPIVFGNAAASAADAGSLDRAAITAGVAQVKAQVLACARPRVKGTVRISVQVAPAGTVASAKVVSAPDADLGKCVAGAFAKATFAKTVNGGSFSYPFVF